MTDSEQKRAVFVTGASSGIGREVTRQLDRLGFEVFASVRRQEDADSLCDEEPGDITPVLMDVTDETSIHRAAAFIGSRVGERGLYGLLNNAAIGIGGPMEFFPVSEVRRLYEVNVFGLLAVTQVFLPLVRKARGRVANVSSLASEFAMPFHGVYSSAKRAVDGLTHAMRLELAPMGVDVSLILPGSVKTSIWQSSREEITKIAQLYPADLLALYAENYRSAVRFVVRGEKEGIPVEEAGREVVRVFTDRKPRIKYYIGPDARKINIMLKLLSQRAQDRMFMRLCKQKNQV